METHDATKSEIDLKLKRKQSKLPLTSCVTGVVEDEEDNLANSEKIDQEILQDLEFNKQTLKRKQQIKIIVLGMEESGKSTFIKQSRIMYGSGYTDAERSSFNGFVFQSLVKSMHELIKAMTTLKIQYDDPENYERAERVRKLSLKELPSLTPAFVDVEAIKDLWKDGGIQECFCRRRHSAEQSDSTQYFMENIDRFFSPGYIPSVQDILRIRIPTNEIAEHNLQKEEHQFSLIDASCQQTTNIRKWLHCFELVDAIIFIASLSDFDKVSEEGRNRLEESKELFQTVVTYPMLRHVPIILLLNKNDILQEKMSKESSPDLSDYFPKYDGPKKDVINAREFILKMFVDLNQDRERDIYSHFTSVIGNNEIQSIFAAAVSSKTSRAECELLG